jgi:phosphotriesterase-related protein
MTVTGPIPADQLGRVLVHEHVQISYAGERLDPKYRRDREADIAFAVQRMAQLAAVGVRTFVDPCPIELGRDPELLAEIARRSGMNIVCATGFYHEAASAGIPFYWRQRWPEEIAELYLHEIEHGIGSTGIRPGVIKIATGDPVSRHERKVVAGAALAAVESGLPIISHTEHSRWGDVQQEILAEHGVDLNRCLIGHLDQVESSDDLRAIIERGSFVGIDRIGAERHLADSRRAELVVELVHSGHAHRLCVSQDHLCCLTAPRPPYWIPKDKVEWFDAEIRPNLETEMFGRPHTFLFTDFLPRLAALGLDPVVVEQLLVDNPRSLLVGEGRN